ncbi:MAG: helix-turn-helix domain-containing protein [Pseudomonadota bacterium]
MTGQTNHRNVISTTIAFALSRGMSMEEIEAAIGYDRTVLDDPEGRLDDRIPHRIWVALNRRGSPKDAPCIEAARGATFLALCGLAEGVQFAPTLRDAVVFLARNGPHLADRLDIDLVEEPRGLRLTTTHPNDVLDEGRVGEVGAALVVRLIREILGFPQAVIEVEIGYAPLGPPEAYAAFFRCPIGFHAGRHSVLIAREALARPNKSAQPALFKLVEHQFALSLERLRRGRPHPDLLRLKQAAAQAAAGGDYRVASVCERAGMSERTAQRIAAADGTTVGALIAENRRAAAETLLLESAMSIEAIAAVVGFSDDRAFRRAFRRWTGRSPSSFRRVSGRRRR